MIIKILFITQSDRGWVNGKATGTINGKPFEARETVKGGLGGKIRWTLDGEWTKGERIAFGKFTAKMEA